MDEGLAVGILGGTGPLGRGLALRLAGAGRRVWLGSREAGRAGDTAAELRASLPPGASLSGATNQEVVNSCQLLLLTVPYQAAAGALAQLAGLDRGQVLVSTAVPMEFRDGLPFPVHPSDGSAAEEAQRLCSGARVVAAFHTVAARNLEDIRVHLDEDILVCAENESARAEVMALVGEVPGLRPVDAGGIANASLCEGLTPLLLRLNRLHRARAGIRLTGI